jgi:hypothetical protein
MPRNIRNTRRNFARPSDSVTPAASAGALVDSSGYPGSTIGITKTSNPLGPTGTGVYTVTSVPSGLTGSLTTSATTGTISFSAPASTSAATFDIYVSDANYNGAGKPVKAANPITIPAAFQASVLVIAGGGAGGHAQGGSANCSGGGGGGGYREFSGYNLLLSTNYAVQIGAGGTSVNITSTNGGASVFSGVTAAGGGYGGTIVGGGPSIGGSGGSSGGSAGRNGTNPGPGSVTAITPFPTLELYSVQGFIGGTSPNPGAGSAGGSSATAGGAAGSGGGGNAGNGQISSISGTSTRRAGGGGGGGSGGGGSGASGGGAGGGSNVSGDAGTANTGGGGGGACSNPNDKVGGSGGSGIVILRYPDTQTITIGAGLTGTTATTGSFKVTTITAGTGNVSWA